MFAHIVGANCNSPILQITHISNSSPFQICPHFKFAMLQFTLIPNRLHVTICPHSKFAHIANYPMLLYVFFPQIAPISNSPPLQIAHVFNCPYYKFTHVTIHPHVEGLIAISPYTCVIRTFANIPVNTQKRHHEHGMGSFVHVVGVKSASWHSGVCDAIRSCFKFAHVFNCP